MNNTFVYTGGGRDEVPRRATHVIIHESITVIPSMLFHSHYNIVEVYCHAGVKRIKANAFHFCPRLRRVVMPGVEAVETEAFNDCECMVHVDCDNLEQIGSYAFVCCTSLSSINLPSAQVIEEGAFSHCTSMTEAIFGANLEAVGVGAFEKCTSLERVVIPLKNDLIAHDNTFQACQELVIIDLVEADILDQTIAALNLEEWRNDITAEVGSINQSLHNTEAGCCADNEGYNTHEDEGEKAMVIRGWISCVLEKIIYYKAQHRRLLKEAATVLQLAAPNDIVVNNVFPFLEMPPLTFGGEED